MSEWGTKIGDVSTECPTREGDPTLWPSYSQYKEKSGTQLTLREYVLLNIWLSELSKLGIWNQRSWRCTDGSQGCSILWRALFPAEDERLGYLRQCVYTSLSFFLKCRLHPARTAVSTQFYHPNKSPCHSAQAIQRRFPSPPSRGAASSLVLDIHNT